MPLLFHHTQDSSSGLVNYACCNLLFLSIEVKALGYLVAVLNEVYQKMISNLIQKEKYADRMQHVCHLFFHHTQDSSSSLVEYACCNICLSMEVTALGYLVARSINVQTKQIECYKKDYTNVTFI